MKISLCLVAAVAVCTVTAWAGKNIPVADLPQPLFDALVKKYPQAKIISIEKDKLKEQDRYEITFDDGGTKKEAVVMQDGTVDEAKIDE